MMRDTTHLAIFESPEEALRFSYRHAQGVYPVNTLSRWQAKPGSEPPRLPSGLDAATAAGWVRNVVEGGNGAAGMVEPYRSILLAKHSVNPALNLRAKLNLVDEALNHAMGTGLHKRRMVDLLIQRYFGGRTPGPDGKLRPIRQHQIADQCGVCQKTVSNAYTKLRNWLDDKDKTATELVTRALAGRGLVE